LCHGFQRVSFWKRLAASAGKRDRETPLQELGARWSTYNRWVAQTSRQSGGRFTTLVAVDPVLFGEQWTRAEIDAHLREGAIGLKITPLFIGAYADDSRMFVLWEEANRRDLGVLTLSTGPLPAQAMAALGMPAGHTDINHPKTFEPILKAYPRCRIVLAHMGSGAEAEVARLTKLYPNLFCRPCEDITSKSGVPSVGIQPPLLCSGFRRRTYETLFYSVTADPTAK
jgi:predicted TIM-barrel fold metal-dependent hydrolase